MSVKTLSRPIWWTVFIVATVTLSNCFHWFKTFTVHPTLENGLSLLGIFLILCASLLVLVYDSYIKERAQGKIQRPSRFLEWMYRHQLSRAEALRNRQNQTESKEYGARI